MPTPRGAGIAFVSISTASSFLALTIIPYPRVYFDFCLLIVFALLPLALFGFVDDRLGLPVRFRLYVQLMAAVLIIFLSPLSRDSLLSLSIAYSLLLFPLLLVFVIALINFTNFMDGLDGLLAGCASIAFSAATIYLDAPWVMWSLVGALFGFLSWNWSPAKVFMGDVGSTYLGGVFALLVFLSPTWIEALTVLFVGVPLFADAFICVLRRLIAGQRVFQPHRLHLYQRLHQAGWPHAHVSSLYIATTALLSIALLLGGLPWVMILSIVVLLVGFWLDQHVAVPFHVASQQ